MTLLEAVAIRIYLRDLDNEGWNQPLYKEATNIIHNEAFAAIKSASGQVTQGSKE